jgi:hypothetical protein
VWSNVAATVYSTGAIADAWSRGNSTTAASSSARPSTSGISCSIRSPETFSVPKRFAKHMMIVADLDNGNPDAVEDAFIEAWGLQSGR